MGLIHSVEVHDHILAVCGLQMAIQRGMPDAQLDKAFRLVSLSISDGLRRLFMQDQWKIVLGAVSTVALMCYSAVGEDVWLKYSEGAMNTRADRALVDAYLFENGAKIAVEENLDWSVQVREVGRELVKTLRTKTQADLSPLNWHFASIQQNSLWMLSIPGGTVLLSDSLLRHLQPTKSELAALVAYAMSPVVHRNALHLAVYKGVCLFLFTLPMDPIFPLSCPASFIVGSASISIGEYALRRRYACQAQSFALALLLDHTNNFSPYALAGLFRKLAVINNEVADLHAAGIHVGRDDYTTRADELDWFVEGWLTARPQ